MLQKKQQIGDANTLQGTQTEGGDLAQAVCSEEGREKDENMYTFHLFQFKEVCYVCEKVLGGCFFSQVGPIEGPSPKPRSGHRIVYHKGKIYSFGGFNPAVDGADPDLEGDEYWQDSKPLFKVRPQITSSFVGRNWQGFIFAGAVGTKFDNSEVDKVTNEGGHSRTVGELNVA